MKKYKLYYLTGALLAIFIAFYAIIPEFINAFTLYNLATIPKELRISHDLGIIDLENTTSKSLRKPISILELSNILVKFLNLLGIPNMHNIKSLQEYKIIHHKKLNSEISRKSAVEMLCRLLMYLSDLGIVKIENTKHHKFADYSAPQKYLKEFSWLHEKEIVKGYNNNFYPNKNLTKVEAIYLLYRLYENISLELATKQQSLKEKDKENEINVQFIDLPIDHPIIPKIKLLYENKIFRYVQKSKTLDGESGILMFELFGLLKAFFENNFRFDEKQISLKDYSNFIAIKNLQKYATRKDLLLSLSYFINKANINFDQNQITQTKQNFNLDSNYPENIIRSLTFIKNSNISLGYNTNNLALNELTNWFEIINILYSLSIHYGKSNETKNHISATIEPKTFNLSSQKEEFDRVVQKKDFEEFMANLKSAKLRINRILKRLNGNKNNKEDQS